MKQENAVYADAILSPINIPQQDAVQENVQVFFVPVASIEPDGIEDVYNMEVDECHNFAVNGGAIMHNCDALRYYVNSLPDWRFEP